MQETEFIQQNKDKWNELEQVLGKPNKDPDRLTTLFIETTDDLSYSRTFYQNRSVRVYLNKVAQQVYQAIYKNKKGGKNFLSRYWKNELPTAMWHHRNELLQSTLIFTAGLLIGIISSIYYPDFAQIMLGESYIEMTEANIEHGDPMAVYQDENAIEMFFRIAWNNIRISFTVFVFGIVFGLGAYFFVLYNSIMVGAFIYFFIERDLFQEAFLAIMLHGTLELSMIVLSGCAGLALARGLLFPGTYKRSEALIMSARNGIKIMISVTIFLFVAALIESFATRYTRLNGIENGQLILDTIRGLMILASAAIVIGYFVIYPRIKYKRGEIPNDLPDEPAVKQITFISTESIKKAGALFTESFYLFSQNARGLAILAVSIGIAFTGLYGLFTWGDFNAIYERPDSFYDYIDYFNPLDLFWVWNSFEFHFDFDYFPMVYLALTFMLALWAAWISKGFEHHALLKKRSHFNNRFLKALLPASVAVLCMLLPEGLGFFVMLFIIPLCLLWYTTAVIEQANIFSALPLTFQLLAGNFFKFWGGYLLLFTPIWLTLFLINSQLIGLLAQFIEMNLRSSSYLSLNLYSILNTFLIFGISAFIFSLQIYYAHLYYFSAREQTRGEHLRAAIDKIGIKSRAYGLEKEI
ncbi:MAG: hypothetical protein RLZZ77_828 [Bacteroidota bacterium]|jgi:uncharacterized membrane protein SpoIIM required for sporulation